MAQLTLEKDGDEWIVKSDGEIVARHIDQEMANTYLARLEGEKIKKKMTVTGNVLPVSTYEQDLSIEELEAIAELD
jgi:hypothetical protein